MRSFALRVATVEVALAAIVTGSAWAVIGAVLAALALVRVRRKWLYQWTAQALRFRFRRRSLPPGSGPMGLLELLRPAAIIGSIDVDGVNVGVIEDARGMSALIELGDPGELVTELRSLTTTRIPTADGIHLQLLISATAAADGSGAAATSYRQLTEGRVLARRRILVVVRAETDGTALAGAVRRVRRRLEPCRPLGPDTVPRALAELAHQDPAHPFHESWSAVELGGVRQTTFKLRAWPETLLLERLLTIPGTGTTVALTTDSLTIRLAGPDTGALARLLDVERLNGSHRDGLAGTLPLGSDGGTALPPLTFRTGGDGLVIGVDRHGAPVTVRLFRPEPTRAVLVGDLRCAATIVLRALAVGAQVLIRSSRPYAWEPFLRGLSGAEPVALVPPGRPPDPPTGVRLTVVDVGPAGQAPTEAGTTLFVREDLAGADADLLARADLAILQPLAPEQVAIAASALGLGDAAGWLTRTSKDMVAVVAGRRTLRWALLSNTPVEKQVIRVPDRAASMARSPAWES
jgi:type VII secretion protein EccE